MNGSRGTRDVIGEYALNSLQSGHFNARRGDLALRDSLRRGSLEIQESLVPIGDVQTFSSAADLSRKQQLDLHTFRWLDVLRRTSESEGQFSGLWDQALMAWSESDLALDSGSLAWLPFQVEMRSAAIALAVRAVSPVMSLVDSHLAALSRIDEELQTSSNRQYNAFIRVVLEWRSGASRDRLEEILCNAARGSVFVSGYALDCDLEMIAESVRSWRRMFVDLDISVDQDISERLRGSEFWLHAHAPDGTLVPIGGGIPENVPGSELSEHRYAVTAGGVGDAPSNVSFVDPAGLVAFRSGWGETELAAEDETLVTMLLGPVRGPRSHRDPSRITFHSQGRDWLVDPTDVTASSEYAHSVVVIEGVRYRRNGVSKLSRHYNDGLVEGVVSSNTLYSHVAWERHMAFARTGNYLVVQDSVRRSSSFLAVVQWIVAPDVNIDQHDRHFELSDGERRVVLSVASESPFELSFDEIKDASNERIAWRLQATTSCENIRIVSIIVDAPDLSQLNVGGVEFWQESFAVNIVNGRLNEQFVMTPALSSVSSVAQSARRAIARTIDLSVAGSLSESESLQQRLDVRSAINVIKESVWNRGASASVRRSGIRELIQAGYDLRVGGLRDHGFGSALIDLAANDLFAEVADHPQVMSLKRTGLVSWSEGGVEQAMYKVPLQTTLDPSVVPNVGARHFVWSVDCGQLVPSSYIADERGDCLVVYFHGATNRNEYSMPRFERLRSLRSLAMGPLMLFSDPGLDLNSQMILSWYVGTEDVDLHDVIARMIVAFAQKRGVERVLLVGNSGGGFAALQVGARIDGARILSFNPQVVIDRYVPRLSRSAHWSSFGRESVAGIPAQSARMNIIEKYSEIAFQQQLTLVQNPGDDHHYKEHFLPLVRAYEGSLGAERLTVHQPYLGAGHRVPSPHEYLEFVREAARHVGSSSWTLRGLRTRKGSV